MNSCEGVVKNKVYISKENGKKYEVIGFYKQPSYNPDHVKQVQRGTYMVEYIVDDILLVTTTSDFLSRVA